MKNHLYVEYHDNEWGIENHDDGYLFEMLILESFQAGLSWECILNKGRISELPMIILTLIRSVPTIMIKETSCMKTKVSSEIS